MSSWNNLRDASRMLPAWFLSFLAAVGVVGLYVLARFTTVDKPNELISNISLWGIVISTLVGFGFLVAAIAKAKAGNVVAAIGEGFHRALTFVWVTSAVALGLYVCAIPAMRLLTANIYYTAVTVGVLVVLGVGYFASGVRPKAAAVAGQLAELPATALALPATFNQTMEQCPAFQVTLADQNRLLIHQAARVIGYKGSNCLIAESFNAQLDINARTAKIFTDLNLLSTAEMIYWRMHMLLIGSAAEQLILNSTSDAAMDDLQNFDDLAIRYLQLTNKGNFYRPVSDTEAKLKVNRLSLLRTSIGQRCAAAVAQNQGLIMELIKLMRGRPSLLYLDLKHILDRVEMPADFPRAEFDTSEAMEKVLLQLTHDEPEPIQGDVLEDVEMDQPANSNVRIFPPGGSVRA